MRFFIKILLALLIVITAVSCNNTIYQTPHKPTPSTQPSSEISNTYPSQPSSEQNTQQSKVPSFNLPRVIVFKVEPANILSEQEAILTWEVQNAYDVVIEPGFRIIRAKGNATVNPAFTTTYKLTATNDQGTIIATTTLTVSGAPITEETPSIVFFIADPYVIKKGESAILSWKTTEASSVTIDNGIGIVAGTGTTRVSPSETTTYKMIAINPRGAQFQTVTVNVK